MDDRREKPDRRALPIRREAGRRLEDVRERAEHALSEAEREIARVSVLLHPSTVAKRLNVNVETVRVWIRRGMIPSITLPNGYYRVTGATLDRLIAEKETASNRP